MAVARAYNRWIMARYLTRERGFYGGILAAAAGPGRLRARDRAIRR